MAVLEQASSGLTIKAFCKQQGLAVHSFYAWRREIRMRDETLETQAVSLVPVTVTDANPTRKTVTGTARCARDVKVILVRPALQATEGLRSRAFAIGRIDWA